MKNLLILVAVVAVGALLGSFLGKFIGIYFPSGNIHELFATDLTAGLSPSTLDLRVIVLTFGCMLKFNVTSVLGMIVSALMFKSLIK